MIRSLITFGIYYFRGRRMGRNFRNREEFLKWRASKIQSWMVHHANRQMGFPLNASRQSHQIIDKKVLMEDFAKYNKPGMTAEQGFAALEGSRRFGDCHVGVSTGTSGNRGLYIISNEERYAWLGTILGKVLPGFWRKKRKIAVVLPLNSSLYDAASKGSGRRLDLRFFDVMKGPENWSSMLYDFNPDIIVAPPRVLRWLAENHEGRLKPERILSGAEVLDFEDRKIIFRNLGPVHQIYMATEGLLATTCEHGNLHLAEDVMHFELHEAGDGLVSPIITDFSRTTQIMMRYRMNDLLRMSKQPCTCGSPFLVVDEIVGRQDDVFVFEGGVQVTPDVIRNTVIDADRRINDFRVRQVSSNKVEIVLPLELPKTVGEAARDALDRVLGSFASGVTVTVSQEALEFDSSKKQKRVECLSA